MSIHVCKCIHNGAEEFHLRYPGITEQSMQHIADNLNANLDILVGDQKKLGSFYNVYTKGALIKAMEGHIARLQERVSCHIEIGEQRFITGPREG